MKTIHCLGKTDEELAVLTLKDQDYFSCIVERYEGKLSYYLFRLVSINKEDNEDLLQDIFIKVYENLNDFDPRLKFSSWIYRIAHNEAINYWRKTKARPQVLSKIDSTEILNRIVHDAKMEEKIDLKLVNNDIQRVLSKLDVRYREILILKYLEQKDYSEISDILKKPLGSIASMLYRAKRQFLYIAKKNNIKF